MTRTLLSRRAFASSLAASLALSGLSRTATASTPAPRRRRAPGPSKLVIINLFGGSDDMYTCDPRLKSELKKGMGPGWDESQITTHGTIRVAPPWKPLEPYLSRMQVLLGVQTFSVAHPNGNMQMTQWRTRISDQTEESLLTLAGDALAPNAPVPAINLDRALYPSRGRMFADFRGKVLEQLQRAANDDDQFDVAQRAIASAFRTCSGSDCHSLRAVSELMSKLRGTKKVSPPERRIDPTEWPAGDRQINTRRFTGIEFSWADLLFSKGMCSAITMNPYGVFDTHVNNEANGAANHQTALSLRELMDNLAKRPGQNGGATLLDETGFVIAGELGRFPYINTNMGKDHFPQISVALIGPGLRQGTFGETNREMVGQKVSFSTGKPGPNGALMTLDDVGRSLLEWVGHPAPDSYGYDGRVLDFMFA